MHAYWGCLNPGDGFKLQVYHQHRLFHGKTRYDERTKDVFFVLALLAWVVQCAGDATRGSGLAGAVKLTRLINSTGEALNGILQRLDQQISSGCGLRFEVVASSSPDRGPFQALEAMLDYSLTKITWFKTDHAFACMKSHVEMMRDTLEAAVSDIYIYIYI